MNKNTVILLLALNFLLLSEVKLYAQYNDRQVEIHDEKISRHENSTSLQFTINTHTLKIASSDALILTPELFTDTKYAPLPKVVINGKKRHKIYRREEALGIHKEDKTTIYKVLQNGIESAVINYAVNIPFEPWMQSAKLRLRKETCGCPGKKTSPDYIVASSFLEKTIVSRPVEETPEETTSLYLHFMEPEKETVKTRSEYGEAYLNFIVNKWDILYNYKENARKLDQVQSFFKKAQEDNNIVMDAITIIGYASPEDTYEHNMNLSRNRATAFANWVMARFHFSKNIYTVQWKGEDWGKLREVVEKSNMNEKYQILNIIDTYPIFEGRETKLMNLNGGHPYNYMLENMFPKLRRVYYRIDYTVRPFSVEESRFLIDKKPSQLSVFEMYEAANSYQKGSNEFNNAMDKAIELYPQDIAVKNNAAAIALQEGRLQEAKALIDQTTDSPSRQNNIGVYFMLTGNYTKAKEAFTKAMRGGIADAQHNLDILAKQQAANKKKEQKNMPRSNSKTIPYTIK